MTKTKTVQKVFGSMIAFAMVVTMSFGFLVTPAAQAQTAEELQAQIATLLAQIAALQAQLGQPSGVSGLPAGFTFTSNLSMGSTGMEVMRLQQFLNADAQTRVATTGAGSPGNETQNFGPLTRGAVMNFQQKYASEVLAPLGLVSPTGFWGASSRAKANALIAVTPPPANDDPANDEPANDDPATVNDGVEGMIDVDVASLPAGPTELARGTSNQHVMDFEVKATDSDVVVRRVDLNFGARPWLTINHLGLFDGDNAIAGTEVTQATSHEVTVATNYRIRLSGLNVTVPAGTTKTFSVKVGTPAAPVTGAATSSPGLLVQLAADAVRATDGLGLNIYDGDAGVTRGMFVEATPTTSEVVPSLNVENPGTSNARVRLTSASDNVELLRFNLKAENQTTLVRQLGVDLTTAPTALADVVEQVRLYEIKGGTATLLGTKAPSATTTFDGLSVNIPKDETAVFSVQVRMKGLTGNYTEGEEIEADFDDANLVAEGVDFVTSTVPGTTLSGSTVTLYSVAPQLDLVSATFAQSASPSDGTQGNGSIVFDATALGGDVWISKTAATALVMDLDESVAGASYSLSSPAVTGDIGAVFYIPENTTRRFTVSAVYDSSGAGVAEGAFHDVTLTTLNWGVLVGSPAARATGPDNWTTPEAYIN